MKAKAIQVRTAKAGDKLTDEAQRALQKLLGYAEHEALPENVLVVHAKTEDPAPLIGQWFCITCGTPIHMLRLFWTHAKDKPTHKFAWRCFDSGLLEEP